MFWLRLHTTLGLAFRGTMLRCLCLITANTKLAGLLSWPQTNQLGAINLAIVSLVSMQHRYLFDYLTLNRRLDSKTLYRQITWISGFLGDVSCLTDVVLFCVFCIFVGPSSGRIKPHYEPKVQNKNGFYVPPLKFVCVFFGILWQLHVWVFSLLARICSHAAYINLKKLMNTSLKK